MNATCHVSSVARRRVEREDIETYFHHAQTNSFYWYVAIVRISNTFDFNSYQNVATSMFPITHHADTRVL